MASLMLTTIRYGLFTSFSCARNYAVKSANAGALMALGKGKKKEKGGKAGAVVEKVVLPVETDATKLVNYVCGSNIYIKGEDVKIKPDSEYPDWLWNLRLGKPPTILDLDPSTKEYWKKVRTMAIRRNNRLRKLKKFT